MQEWWRKFHLDIVSLAPIIGLASLVFWTSPRFAANLPQDAVNFSLPSISFLETGRFALTAYGQAFPPAHPIGMAILLLPAYAIAGLFPGNGIFVIYAFALGTVALVYFIGKMLLGRVCAIFSALFLVTHNGFQGYSHKIMSEVPSAFLLLGVLGCILYLCNQDRPEKRAWVYLVIGLLTGLAVVVRYDNILVIVPLALLVVMRRFRVNFRQAALLAAGFIPSLAMQAAFNHFNYGKPWRTGYHYWGNTGTQELPLFSPRYATSRGYWLARGYSPEIQERLDGGFLFQFKSLADQADQSSVLSPKFIAQGRSAPSYLYLVVARSLLGITGLVMLVVCYRGYPSVKATLAWFGTFAAVLLLFYMMYYWQETRYVLRLVPLFCLLNGAAVSALLAVIWRAHWSQRLKVAAASAVLVPVAALLFSIEYYQRKKLVYPGDDITGLFKAIHEAAKRIEPNAVIVTNWDPFRTEAFLVKGTQRLCLPLRAQDGVRAFPRPGSPLERMFPFAAEEEPEKLVELMDSGRPLYLLLREPFEETPYPNLDLIEKNFRLQARGFLDPTQETTPYFIQLHSSGVPFIVR